MLGWAFLFSTGNPADRDRSGRLYAYPIQLGRLRAGPPKKITSIPQATSQQRGRNSPETAYYPVIHHSLNVQRHAYAVSSLDVVLLGGCDDLKKSTLPLERYHLGGGIDGWNRYLFFYKIVMGKRGGVKSFHLKISWHLKHVCTNFSTLPPQLCEFSDEVSI